MLQSSSGPRARWRKFWQTGPEILDWRNTAPRLAPDPVCRLIHRFAAGGAVEHQRLEPEFLDTLEGKNVDALWWAVIVLPALVVFSGLAVSGALVARMTMQTCWRECLTETLAGWWLEDKRYYRDEIAADEQTSPEYRIAKDVQLAVDPLVEFAVGFLTALATASAFIGVLWTVGDSFEQNFFGAQICLPGYLEPF